MGVANLMQIEYWSRIVCFTIEAFYVHIYTYIYIYTLMDNVSYPQIVYIDSMFYSSYSCFIHLL